LRFSEIKRSGGEGAKMCTKLGCDGLPKLQNLPPRLKGIYDKIRPATTNTARHFPEEGMCHSRRTY
jgi:hypothetical protein